MLMRVFSICIGCTTHFCW